MYFNCSATETKPSWLGCQLTDWLFLAMSVGIIRRFYAVTNVFAYLDATKTQQKVDEVRNKDQKILTAASHLASTGKLRTPIHCFLWMLAAVCILILQASTTYLVLKQNLEWTIGAYRWSTTQDWILWVWKP